MFLNLAMSSSSYLLQCLLRCQLCKLRLLLLYLHRLLELLDLWG